MSLEMLGTDLPFARDQWGNRLVTGERVAKSLDPTRAGEILQFRDIETAMVMWDNNGTEAVKTSELQHSTLPKGTTSSGIKGWNAKAVNITGGSIGLVGFGATIYLFAKGRWGWALVNFFLITPLVAISGASLAGTVAAKEGTVK